MCYYFVPANVICFNSLNTLSIAQMEAAVNSIQVLSSPLKTYYSWWQDTEQVGNIQTTPSSHTSLLIAGSDGSKYGMHGHVIMRTMEATVGGGDMWYIQIFFHRYAILGMILLWYMILLLYVTIIFWSPLWNMIFHMIWNYAPPPSPLICVMQKPIGASQWHWVGGSSSGPFTSWAVQLTLCSWWGGGKEGYEMPDRWFFRV